MGSWGALKDFKERQDLIFISNTEAAAESSCWSELRASKK